MTLCIICKTITEIKVSEISRMLDNVPDNDNKQGESLSPILFAMNISEVESIMINFLSIEVFVGDSKIFVLKYADDFDLCSVASDG